MNNAGVLKRTPLLEITEEEWDAILDVNLKGYFLVGQAVARRMIEDGTPGAIINVSSAGQAVAAPNLTHYCVSKAGVEMLTKQLALELASHKIRVNAIAPGLIETDMNRADIAQEDFRKRGSPASRSGRSASPTTWWRPSSTSRRTRRRAS